MLATTRHASASASPAPSVGPVPQVHDDDAHVVGAAPAQREPREDGGGDLAAVLGHYTMVHF